MADETDGRNRSFCSLTAKAALEQRESPRMREFPLEALNIEDTPCGRVCLSLSARVGWQEFPEFARELVSLCEGTVTQKADTAEIRVWHVTVGDSDMNLVFQDCPAMVSLESLDAAGDRLVRDLYGLLRQEKSRTGR